MAYGVPSDHRALVKCYTGEWSRLEADHGTFGWHFSRVGSEMNRTTMLRRLKCLLVVHRAMPYAVDPFSYPFKIGFRYCSRCFCHYRSLGYWRAYGAALAWQVLLPALALLAVLFAVGCSGSSPTAPTPPPATPPVVVVPPVVTPPVMVATPSPLLSDARFSLSFYRDFALGARDGGPYSLRRLTQAPRIYLRTVDDAGRAIDAYSLNETAAALINVAASLTGVFGLAGLEQGTETRQGQPGWVTVRWADKSGGTLCGTGAFAGDLIVLYPQTPGCRCSGGPAVRLKTVKHELGHVLGFYHTDSPDDLMYTGSQSTCDKNPSAREVFHAQVAYGQPLGSRDPS